MSKRFSLKKDMIWVFAVKLVLLYILWLLCFSHPMDETLKPAQVSAHVFNTTKVSGVSQ